jgi:tetratricopeptide (TPR) repeat protein
MKNIVMPRINVSFSRKILLFFLLAALAFYTISCKKWLDKKPATNISTPETLDDLQAVLDDKGTFNVAKTPSLPESSADDYILTQSVFQTLAEKCKAAYTWTADPYNLDNDWQLCYFPINAANICLEQVEKIAKTGQNEQQWNNIKGSALFFRSYYFSELLWEHTKAYDPATAVTDLGIVLRLKSDINIPSTRATVENSYQQAIADVKEASNYLPPTPIHCLRPSKAAAYGLLSRIYLAMRRYEDALHYAELCLGIDNSLMDYNGDSDILSAFSNQDIPFRKYNKETIFYTHMNGANYGIFPQYGLVNPSVYTMYNENDLRKSAFFRPNSTNQVFKGSYSGNEYTLFTGIAIDEILLTKAECLARIGGPNKTGDKEGALSVLNGLLRKRWKKGLFNDINTATARQALDSILLERRKELIFRGHRWMDLKRLNKEGANITLERSMNGQTYSLPPNDNRYALPLPQEIIDRTGMPQNPR